MEPIQIRLNEALYRERLAAAEQAHQRRLTWVATSGPIDRLRLAISQLLSALGRQIRIYVPLDRVDPQC